MKAKAPGFVMAKYQIHPSSDFLERTILRIMRLDQRRRLVADITKLILIFLPFFIREAWLFVRQDYFSVSHMPMGRLLISAYGFFLSSLTFYLFLIGGAAVAGLYLLGSRRLNFLLRQFNQVFSVRLRI